MTESSVHCRQSNEDDEPASDLSRVFALSDGVFAIALTLLVLSLNVPAPGPDLMGQVIDLAPKLRGYALSFLVIIVFWMSHHRLFRDIRRHDTTLLWLNALVLMAVAFLPFPVSLLGEGGDQRFAVIFYNASMIATSLMLTLLWWYASSRRRLISAAVTQAYIRYTYRRGIVVPSVFLLSILLAFFSVTLANAVTLLLLPALYLVQRHYPGIR